MFLGLFIFAAGILSLLESLGVITADIKWGIPLAVTVFGISLIYDSFILRKNGSKKQE